MPINLKPFVLASVASGGDGRQDANERGNDMDGNRPSEFPDDDDDDGMAFVVPPEPDPPEPPEPEWQWSSGVSRKGLSLAPTVVECNAEHASSEPRKLS